MVSLLLRDTTDDIFAAELLYNLTRTKGSVSVKILHAVRQQPIPVLSMYPVVTVPAFSSQALHELVSQVGVRNHRALAMTQGWLIGIVGNTQILHSLHHLGMWAIVVFMIIHIYAAIREDIMSRQSMVSTMISGHRTFKDDRPE